jgi:hypothetical protein
MPAAEITELKVTWHDERRGSVEYSPPMKKAEVSLFASVPEGADPVAALNYVTRLAQDKVKEMLMGSTAAVAVEVDGAPFPPTSVASPAPNGSGDSVGEPQRRTRRTRAQIEADDRAAALAAEQTTTQNVAGVQVSETTSASSTSTTASAGTDDEWAAAAPDEVTITDAELNHTCSVTAERVKDPAKVKGVIGNFNPGGDAFDPAKPGGQRFTVNDIPAQQRADFIAQLKALT